MYKVFVETYTDDQVFEYNFDDLESANKRFDEEVEYENVTFVFLETADGKLIREALDLH